VHKFSFNAAASVAQHRAELARFSQIEIPRAINIESNAPARMG
jgi:hypothetical protein